MPHRLTCPTRTATIVTILLLSPALPAFGQPAVVPTSEGFLGTQMALGEKITGATFEPIRDVVFGGLLIRRLTAADVVEIEGSDLPPTGATPLDVKTAVAGDVATLAAASAVGRDGLGNDLAALSFAFDGDAPLTLSVAVVTIGPDGNQITEIEIPDVSTFLVANDTSQDTGIAVDDQGRVTVTYTELQPGTFAPTVNMQRLDGLTGDLLGDVFAVSTDDVEADVAILKPDGSQLIISGSNGTRLEGRILDVSAATPQLVDTFPIVDADGAFKTRPQVAVDPSLGRIFTVWDDTTGDIGDPVNIRGRRFDAMGNPLGEDFQVNTTTPGAQGQPAVAYGPGNLAAVAWAGDGAPGDGLDVFTRVYDVFGNPIGDEIRVPTTTAGIQDRPAVRFLPELDAQGRPQMVITWREVVDATGTPTPLGTGARYRAFSIDGVSTEPPVFIDGFESGDTTAWGD